MRNTTGLPMVTTTNADEARDLMISRNRTRRGRTELSVLVNGPEEGEWTVMGLREAIEAGFTYSWEV